MRIKFNLALAMVAFLAVGCIGQLPDTPEGTYAQSLTLFNDSVEVYCNTLILQSPEVKAEWKKDINPLIHKAGAALDIWGMAIGTGTELDKSMIYMQLWRELWPMLFKLGIIKVEE